MRIKKEFLILFFLIMFFCLIFGVPKTIVITKESTICSLSDAVDIANEGDTIIIEEGIYEENITIDKSLKIFGEPGKVILKPKKEDKYILLFAGAKDVSFENIQFSGKRDLVKSVMSTLYISNCKFSTYKSAIVFTGGNLEANNCTFQGYKIKENIDYVYKGCAIISQNASSIILSENYLKDLSTGFKANNASRLESIGNTFENVVNGEDYSDILELTIMESKYLQNYVAINLSGKTNANITNNEFNKTSKWDICLTSENCDLSLEGYKNNFSGNITGKNNISTSPSYCSDGINLCYLFGE